MRGIEYDNNSDLISEETIDEDASNIIGKFKSFFLREFYLLIFLDTLTTANENTREPGRKIFIQSNFNDYILS